MSMSDSRHSNNSSGRSSVGASTRAITPQSKPHPASHDQMHCTDEGSVDPHGINSLLPRVAHPTAKAFFDELENRQKNIRNESTTLHHSINSANIQMSETLQRKIQSVGWRNRYSQEEFYPIEVNSKYFSVRQIQRGEVEGTYGTGATVWPAAIVLIKYLEYSCSVTRTLSMSGRHVIDLGTGTGVTSIAAALLGASSVTCTDGEETVVQLAKDNIWHATSELQNQTSTSSKNQLTSEGVRDEESSASNQYPVISTINGCKVRVGKYWWGSDDPPMNKDKCNMILVADCVLPKLYPIEPLVQAIDECLSTESQSKTSIKPVAIISYEHRYYPEYDPREKFLELAAERNLNVGTISLKEMDPIYSIEDVEIWIVTRKSWN